MAVRSKQLVGQVVPSGSSTVTLYTVPDGETALVKHISVQLVAAASTVTVAIEAVVGGSGVAVFRQTIQPAAVAAQQDMWVCLLPGQQLRVTRSTTATLGIIISGAELEGVAD